MQCITGTSTLTTLKPYEHTRQKSMKSEHEKIQKN